jgi:hypothetical protein
MKTKIKNIDLINLYNTLQKFKKVEVSKYFSYAIVKNSSIIENDYNILKSMSTNTKEYIQFLSERENICKKYAYRDENDKPIIENNKYSIVEDWKEEFKQEIKSLIESNQYVLQSQKEQSDQYQNILKEEVEFDFFMVDFDFIPNEVTPEDLKYISFFVKYPE